MPRPAATFNATPEQQQLNGVNNHDIAVGDFLNGGNRYRGFTYNIKTGKFALVTKPAAPTGGGAPSSHPHFAQLLLDLIQSLR